MAKSKYCKGGKMKYGKGGFWSTLGDVGKTLADLPLSAVGATDVIGEDDYKNEFFKSVDKGTKVAMPVVGAVAATALTAGAAAPAVAGAAGASKGLMTAANVGKGIVAAQQVGSALNPTNVSEETNEDIMKAASRAIQPTQVNIPTVTYKDGGMLNSFSGPSHENGGIAIGQNNEVEGGETKIADYIFSDTLKVPGTKKTFAQLSKQVASKYGKRKNDAMSDKAQAKELEQLKSIQEEVKFIEDAEVMSKLADTNPQLFQQMTGQSANPAVSDLMPGSKQPMTEVPMGQLRKGGKMIKNQSTALTGTSPGVTMELIRSGRHYMDTLVAVTHGRRRRYAKGGTIPDNGERLAYRQEPNDNEIPLYEKDANGNFVAPTPAFRPAVNTRIDRSSTKMPWVERNETDEELRRRILLSQDINPDTGEKIEFGKAPLLINNSGKQYAAEQALKFKAEQEQQMQKLEQDRQRVMNTATRKYSRGGTIPEGEDQPKPVATTPVPTETPRPNYTVNGNPANLTGSNNPIKAAAYNRQLEEFGGTYLEYRAHPTTGEQVPVLTAFDPNTKTYKVVTGATPEQVARYTAGSATRGVIPTTGVAATPAPTRPVQYDGGGELIPEKSLYPWMDTSLYNSGTEVLPTAGKRASVGKLGNTMKNVVADNVVENAGSMSTGAQVGMGIQGAATVARGAILAARNKNMPVEFTPVGNVEFERVSAREPLAQSKSAFAGTNSAIANNSNSSGQYLSNRIVSGATEGMQRAGISEQVNNQNAQIQSQEAQVNAQIATNNAARKLQTGEINQQEYDAVTQAWTDYLNDVSNVGSAVARDVTAYDVQDQAINSLGTSGYQVLYDRNGVEYKLDKNSVYTPKRKGGYLNRRNAKMTI